MSTSQDDFDRELSEIQEMCEKLNIKIQELIHRVKNNQLQMMKLNYALFKNKRMMEIKTEINISEKRTNKDYDDFVREYKSLYDSEKYPNGFILFFIEQCASLSKNKNQPCHGLTDDEKTLLPLLVRCDRDAIIRYRWIRKLDTYNKERHENRAIKIQSGKCDGSNNSQYVLGYGLFCSLQYRMLIRTVKNQEPIIKGLTKHEKNVLPLHVRLDICKIIDYRWNNLPEELQKMLEDIARGTPIKPIGNQENVVKSEMKTEEPSSDEDDEP